MLHNMKGQFAEHLLAAGFVNSRDPKDPKSNTNSGKQWKEMEKFLIAEISVCRTALFTLLSSTDNEKLLKAVICAGLYPKVAKIRPSFSKKRKM